MYPYITCFCGRSLGDVYDAFKALRKKKNEAYLKEENLNIDPDKIPFSDIIKISLEEILNQLHMDAYCCRDHLMTQVEYKELY